MSAARAVLGSLRAAQAARVPSRIAGCPPLQPGANWQRCSHRAAAAAAAPRAAASPAAAAAAEAAPQRRPPSRLESLLQEVRLTHMAQELWLEVLQPGDTAVDATAGNGHDTLSLARAVGPSGSVYAFDVQEAAVVATRGLVEGSLEPGERPQLHLLQACHSTMQEVVGSNCSRAIAFNLGYLPSGDKAITTQRESTLSAVEAALEVLAPGGLMTILCYTGHPGGQEEFEAVRQLVAELPAAYWVSGQTQLLNRPTAPVLLAVWKRPPR